jgi:predicted nucleic acid-binding protein
MDVDSTTTTAPAVDVSALGPGERAALGLAVETPDSLLLLDDAAARAAAAQLGVSTTGTLGLLLVAKAQQLITEVAPVIAKLEERGFRVTEAVRRRILQLAGE